MKPYDQVCVLGGYHHDGITHTVHEDDDRARHWSVLLVMDDGDIVRIASRLHNRRAVETAVAALISTFGMTRVPWLPGVAA